MRNRTEAEIVEMLRRECERDTQRLWAEANGFSQQFICDVLKGRRYVTEKLADALGFRRIVMFEEKQK